MQAAAEETILQELGGETMVLEGETFEDAQLAESMGYGADEEMFKDVMAKAERDRAQGAMGRK